jgi:hypothetical protein
MYGNRDFKADSVDQERNYYQSSINVNRVSMRYIIPMQGT